MRLQIKLASRMSGVSTASMGKFDKALKGEKPGERQPLGKRRKFLSATDTKAEHGQVGTDGCEGARLDYEWTGPWACA